MEFPDHLRFGRHLTTALAFAALLGITGCGSGGGGGGGNGGGSGLAAGTFTRPVILTGTGTGPNTGLFNDATGAMAPAQFLYRAADINGAGRITSLTLRHEVRAVAGADCPDITVKMAHIPTSVTDLVADQATNTGNTIGTMQTVIDGPVSVPSGTYFDVPLDTPFEYNGMDNLFVEFARGAACTDQAPILQAEGLGYDAGSFSSAARAILYHTKFNFEGGDNRVTAADESGDNGNTIAPGRTGRTQMLVRAGDIDGAGPITGIRFDADTVTATSNAKVTVKMAHIDPATTNLGTDFAANYGGASPTTVADSVHVHIPAAASTFWLPLTGSFDYNGTDHVLVDVAMDSDSSFSVDYRNAPDRRIASATSSTASSGTMFSRTFQPTFRFNGGKMAVLTDEGTSTGNAFSNSTNGRMNLYRATELGTAATIKSVACRLSDATSTATTLDNYKVIMGHTIRDTLATTAADNFKSQHIAYDGSLAVPGGLVQGDWITVDLTSPFSYNGEDNLVVWMGTTSATTGATTHRCLISGMDSTRYPGHMGDGAPDAASVTPQDYKFDLRMKIEK